MTIAYSALAILTAYLLGSFPTAYLIVRRLKGVDVREVGDRNMGTTNVFGIIGVKAGIATALGDVAKGAIAVLLAQALAVPNIALVLVAVAAVSGHIWPVFLQFRGGAGLATALGTIFVALPRESVILIVPFALLGATIGRRIGLGESGGLLLVPFVVLCWWFGEPPALIALPIVLAILLFAKKYWDTIGNTLWKHFTKRG